MAQNCYKNESGRIPRELLHDQSERLANKHIQTLSFMQEIANENKELKLKIEQLELENKILKKSQSECEELHALAKESQERIKKIEQQHLDRGDELSTMLVDKHKKEMMMVVEEKLQNEKLFKEKIIKLSREIEELQRTKRDLLLQISQQSQSNEEDDSSIVKLEEKQKEVDDLLNQIEMLKLQQVKQLTDQEQLQNLRECNEKLNQELGELNQRNREMKFKLNKLEKEYEGTENLQEKEDLLETLKNKVSKLHSEKVENVEKIQNYEAIIERLQEELEQLQQAFTASEADREAIHREYKKLLLELNSIKRQSLGKDKSGNFRDFVCVKRELNVIKDENSELKLKLRSKLTSDPLPSIRPEPSNDISRIKGPEKKKNKKIDVKALPYK